MDAQTKQDFQDHPDWFDIGPGNQYRLSEEVLNTLSPHRRQNYLDSLINPPMFITRKPVPFVLKIKGSGLG